MHTVSQDTRFICVSNRTINGIRYTNRSIYVSDATYKIYKNQNNQLDTSVIAMYLRRNSDVEPLKFGNLVIFYI